MMQKYCRVKFNQEQTFRDCSHYQGLFTFVAFISVLFASGARMRPDLGVYRVLRCSISLIEDTMSSSHRRDQGRHSSDYVDAPQPRRTICDQKLAARAVLFPRMHARTMHAPHNGKRTVSTIKFPWIKTRNSAAGRSTQAD